MSKKEKRCVAVVFIFFLLVAGYQDNKAKNLEEDNTIQRASSTGEEKEVALILNGEGVVEDYTYELIVEPAKVTKEEADEFFLRTIAEIEADFQSWSEELPVKRHYQEGMVKAKWQFDSKEYINVLGELIQENIPEEGGLCTAEVALSCGAYELLYEFSFIVHRSKISEQEQLIRDLEQWVDVQMAQEGESKLQLPSELNGISLEWSEKRESLFLQVLLFELAAVMLLFWGRKKQKEEEGRVRIERIEMGYPDVINQLTMLLEAGMTIRQAWQKMAVQYEIKRKRQLIEKDEILERILCMNRRLLEGENERTAYERFAEEVNVRCYHRLMRTCISYLEKGTTGLCAYLNEECRQAYDQRILHAKKLGEEASTKMLLPLMLMMLLVMVIVMLPAIIEFAA